MKSILDLLGGILGFILGCTIGYYMQNGAKSDVEGITMFLMGCFLGFLGVVIGAGIKNNGKPDDCGGSTTFWE